MQHEQHTQGRSGRALLGVVALAVVAATATACGSSGSGASSEAHKPASQVLADAKAALTTAKAVHVDGSVAAGETVDLQLQGADASGTLTDDGTTIHIVNIGGTIYLNAPTAYWTKAAGASAAPLGGKWIEVSAAQSGSAAQLTLAGIAASITTSDSPLDATPTTTTLDGQKAVVLTQKDGSQFFVTDSSTPLPLKLVNAGTSSSKVTFTAYGRTETIAAPAGAVTPQQALGATAGSA